MKITSTVLFIFLNLFGISQENFLFEYKASLKFDEEIVKLNKQYGLMENTEEDVANSKFFLECNQKESFFYGKYPKELNAVDISMVNAVTQCDKLVYTSADSLIVLFQKDKVTSGINSYYGHDNLVVKNNMISNWEITQETKIIEGYNCYKAIHAQSETFNNKTITRTIVAWFSPDIPLPFGPSKYSGLPGLIFEVSEGQVKFMLTKIAPLEKIELTKPTGKILTVKELIDLTTQNANKTIELYKSLKKNN